MSTLDDQPQSLRRSIFWGVMLTLLTIPSLGISATQPVPNRFFLMGSGKLSLFNHRNNQQAEVALLKADNTLNEAALTEVDRVFGFPTHEKNEHISPRMLFMLSYFADQVAPGKRIQIESGYRSLEYNAAIRTQGANAAQTSTHIDGLALDFWIEGIDGKQLWEIIRARNCCGVGHYGGKTIHFDAGRPRFWQAATSGTRSKQPDNNRHVYLTTDFDRYLAHERIRLILAGVSTYGFGVKPTMVLFSRDQPEAPMTTLPLDSSTQRQCHTLNDQKAAHFLYSKLPPHLPAGRYFVRLTFCQRPFPEMPVSIDSNEIELIVNTGK
jgi:uncharacterized protein YcbK (DUF882 family)